MLLSKSANPAIKAPAARPNVLLPLLCSRLSLLAATLSFCTG